MTIPRLDGLDRNILQNGSFPYWQRGTSIVLASSPAYTADRFRAEVIGSLPTTKTASRSTDVPANSESEYSFQFLSATGVPISNGYALTQRVESIFSRRLKNKKASLSFQIKADQHQEVRIILDVPDAKDNFAAVTNFVDTIIPISNDSNWQQIKLENITIPSTAVNGLQVTVRVQNIASATDNFVRIADIKLNLGTKAQEFSLAGRDLVEELQLCQRYYEKSYNVDVAPGTASQTDSPEWLHGQSDNTGYVKPTVSFKVGKRVGPVVQVYHPQTGVAGTLARQLGAPGTAFSDSGTVTSSCEGKFFIYQGGIGSQEATYWFNWTADAEL